MFLTDSEAFLQGSQTFPKGSERFLRGSEIEGRRDEPLVAGAVATTLPYPHTRGCNLVPTTTIITTTSQHLSGVTRPRETPTWSQLGRRVLASATFLGSLNISKGSLNPSRESFRSSIRFLTNLKNPLTSLKNPWNNKQQRSQDSQKHVEWRPSGSNSTPLGLSKSFQAVFFGVQDRIGSFLEASWTCRQGFGGALQLATALNHFMNEATWKLL